jgi:hypothetical protein
LTNAIEILNSALGPSLEESSFDLHLALEKHDRAIVVTADSVLRACAGTSSEENIKITCIEIERCGLIAVSTRDGVWICIQFPADPLTGDLSGLFIHNELQLSGKRVVLMHYAKDSNAMAQAAELKVVKHFLSTNGQPIGNNSRLASVKGVVVPVDLHCFDL